MIDKFIENIVDLDKLQNALDRNINRLEKTYNPIIKKLENKHYKLKARIDGIIADYHLAFYLEYYQCEICAHKARKLWLENFDIEYRATEIVFWSKSYNYRTYELEWAEITNYLDLCTINKQSYIFIFDCLCSFNK